MAQLKPSLASLRPYYIDETQVRVRLDANECPFDLPDRLKDELARELRDVAVNRYPDPLQHRLRCLVAEQEGIGEDQIIFGNGSDELIYMLYMAVGAAVAAVPSPGFSMYAISGRVFDATVLPYPLAPPTFDVDSDAFDAVMARKPSIVFMGNPNNPTGTLFPDDLLERHLPSRDTLFISDEAYGAFCGSSLMARIADHPNLLVMRTVSKIGFASARLGYLAGERELIRELSKVRLPYNINSFSQRVAEFAFRNAAVVSEHVARVVRGRMQLHDGLAALGVRAIPSVANFVTFELPAEGFYDYLVGRGILIKSLAQSFGMDGWFRVSVGTEAENAGFLACVHDFTRS